MASRLLLFPHAENDHSGLKFQNNVNLYFYVLSCHSYCSPVMKILEKQHHFFVFIICTFNCLCSFIACLHVQNNVAFLEGRPFPSQSELFQKLSKSSDWLEKGRPSKKANFVLDM